MFLERDRLGSTRTLTSATGVLVGTYAYSVYGQMLNHTGTVTSPFGFSGEYTDPTGLIYLRARYYDPDTAQFLSIDAFVNDSSTVRLAGTYRGNAAILNYNATSRLVVVQGTGGSFISGWKMSQAQLQNVITRGSLGGG